MTTEIWQRGRAFDGFEKPLRDERCALVSAPPNPGTYFQTKLHFVMSQHRSLKGSSTIAAKRNVLKRFERVEVLKKRGQFKKGDSPLGLRKTKPDV